MMDAVQKKDWANSNTKLIIGRVNEVFNTITNNDSTEKSIKTRDVTQLVNILENMVKNPIRFKYYIYTYLFENYYVDRGKKEYTEISEDEYIKKLKELFEKIGLDKQEKEELIKKLEESVIKIDRKIIFKYAICLNMDEEVVSIIIKKVLLQRELNPRDYEELIYRWSIRNVTPNERWNKIKELIKNYNDNIFPLDSKVEYKLYDDELNVESDDITLVLIDKVNEILDKGEVEFRLFLKSLKESDLRTKESTSLEDEYWRLVSKLCRIDIGTGELLSDEITWEKLEKEIKNLQENAKKGFIELNDKMFYEDDGKNISLIDKNVLDVILKDIKLSRKYFEGRIDRGKKDYERAKGEKSLMGKLLYYIICNDNKIDEEILHKDMARQFNRANFSIESIDYLDSYNINVNISIRTGNDYEVIRMKKTKVKLMDTNEEVDAYVQIENKIGITRKDILFAKFLIYVNGYGKNMNKLRNISVHGFMRDANFLLNSVGMIELYVNNPFDLFLIICFMQKEPLKYFINNWALISK